MRCFWAVTESNTKQIHCHARTAQRKCTATEEDKQNITLTCLYTSIHLYQTPPLLLPSMSFCTSDSTKYTLKQTVAALRACAGQIGQGLVNAARAARELFDEPERYASTSTLHHTTCHMHIRAKHIRYAHRYTKLYTLAVMKTLSALQTPQQGIYIHITERADTHRTTTRLRSRPMELQEPTRAHFEALMNLSKKHGDRMRLLVAEMIVSYNMPISIQKKKCTLSTLHTRNTDARCSLEKGDALKSRADALKSEKVNSSAAAATTTAAAATTTGCKF